jgi:hypothetical protein
MLKSSPQKIKAGTSFEAPAKRKSGEYFPTGNIAALFLSSISFNTCGFYSRLSE